MLGPDDVEDLMVNEGLTTEQIEELRQFYIANIKGKNLLTVLNNIEQSFAPIQARTIPQTRTKKSLSTFTKASSLSPSMAASSVFGGRTLHCKQSSLGGRKEDSNM